MAETPTQKQLEIERLSEIDLTDLHWKTFQEINWDFNKSNVGYQHDKHAFVDLLLQEMRIRGAAE